MFWRSSREKEFINAVEGGEENQELKMLSKVFREVKDKIQVVAADISTEIGRRYAILLGVNPSSVHPCIRILRVDRQLS